MLKKVGWCIIFILLAAIGTELFLRFQYGFCQAPLYVSDADFEYIYAPNQEVNRFGNRVITNRMSMRSAEISENDTTVILLIGDSVINGGSLTDHDSLASTLLEKRLSSTLQRTVRVLNISAGSWGPDNGAAYLKKHGIFSANLICLVASSHDAHDNMVHHDVVGIDTNLPAVQYSFALEELWKRYIYPQYFHNKSRFDISYAPDTTAIHRPGIRKDGVGFNTGFGALRDIALANNIPYLIYLHPETFEIMAGKYNDQGDEIIHFATRDSVTLIRELDLGISLGLYRRYDHIHYNSEGQRFLANKLYPIFLKYLKPDGH